MGEQFVLGGRTIVGPGDVAPMNERTEVDQLHAELAEYYQEMRQFTRLDSVDVFERLSAWTARASEIRHSIVRSDNRRSNNFRTRQLEPFIDECDRQFKFHSRIVAIHETDAKLSGGRFT